MERIYDMIVIGGGPAGYTAALYGARAGLDVVLVEKAAAGGQMALTGEIENYPGFDEGVDGFTLGERMRTGAERFGAATLLSNVSAVALEGDIKRVITDGGELCSRTVVIATGADPRRLGIDGEGELTGRGVHYCAHCDGRFYKGKTVAVIGGGNSAVSDALYLSRLAKKVYLVHRRDELRATKIYHSQLEKAENIELVWNSTVSRFVTADSFVGKRLSGVVLADVKSGEERELTCEGVFVSIGRRPATELFADALTLDANGYVVADESTKTNLKGVFAAGDVRTKALRQIVTAAADGATAAHFVEEYLG